MAKSFPKPTPQVTPANPGQPPRFVPGTTSPLDQTARNFAPRIPVQKRERATAR
jgi:hypothetical protein